MLFRCERFLGAGVVAVAVLLGVGCGPGKMTIQIAPIGVSGYRCPSGDNAHDPPDCEPRTGGDLPNGDGPWVGLQETRACRRGELQRIVLTDLNSDHPTAWAYCRLNPAAARSATRTPSPGSGADGGEPASGADSGEP